MSETENPLGKFQGKVRLFPLPNLVLFPQVMQPLHVFEPRYRQMTAEALQTDQFITMVLLKPGWENEYAGNPSVHSVACLGKVIADQKLADGRFNILLRGMSRVRLVEELPQVKLYRQAQADILCEIEVEGRARERTLKKHLRKHIPQWFGEQKEVLEQLEKLFLGSLPLGTLADILSFTLPLDVELKQDLLEELDVERRVERLLEALAGKKKDPLLPADRKFPPEFSRN